MDEERGPIRALATCESTLRKFAADAAAAGDYDRLARLGALAKVVSELAREWNADDGVGDNGLTTAAGSSTVAAEAQGSDGAGRTRAPIGRSASRKYPRFVRRGDELVKVGWSKRDRREYQHRAGREVLLVLRRTLLERNKRKRLFTMEALKPELGAGESSTPAYQGYVWLAWLRSEGLVKQHGREGYSIVKPATFEQDTERLFATVLADEVPR